MRVLILGSDTPLGMAFIEQQQTLQRHEMMPLSSSACRWKSERQAKKSIVRARCDVVLDARIEAAGDGGIKIQELDLKRCHWIAKACHRTETAYFYVSSARVFSGQLERPYTEEDRPDSEESVGELLAKAEKAVSDACGRHLILRLGPIFSHQGPTLITQMLDPMREGASLILDDNLRGCPVSAADGARVISALLDQLGTGLESWGIYHYGSSDTATFYEFAEALLASASQFFEFGSSAVQLQREPEGLRPLDRTLSCSRIRNTFAIRQVPWRSTIGDIVKRYYQQRSAEESSDGKGH